MLAIVHITAGILGVLLLLIACSGFIHFRSRRWVFLMPAKMIANSLAAYLAIVALLAGLVGLSAGAPVAAIAGLCAALIFAQYVAWVVLSQADFEQAFGRGWLETIPPERRARLSAPRWRLWPASLPEARCDRDVPFWILPGTTRQLLCDIWRPRPDVPRSGLGLIYLHAGEWHTAGKGFGTRPLFRHLAAQGHVVMDVEYRLCPEVDLSGMLGDAWRAVAWMKRRAAQLGVDPGRIVLAGGSAGGQLALLAAYTSGRRDWLPGELKRTDLRPRAVVCYYGPSDLRAFFEDGYGRVNPPDKVRGIAAALLGGLPEQRPELYRKGSPVAYVAPGCPPTLIFQGEHDCGVPVNAARCFHDELVRAGVPVVYVEFPLTDHGFDLQIKALAAIARKRLHLPAGVNGLEDLSQYSPAAQAAMYDLDRFLALMLS